MSSKQSPKIFGLPTSKVGKQIAYAENGHLNAEYETCYFDSYAHFGIHEEMLKDSVRTESYRSAILRNSAQFAGKVVLDIGSGTGILSMFCAQAGAKHVYGIEMAGIAKFSKKIIAENNLTDKITIIQGKVEEIDLPVDKVDIIVSEWMGYLLLFESMLDSVLYARDKWLNPDGLILPDRATLYICGIEDFDFKSEKIHFWDDVYGFDMSCLKDESIKEPLVDFAESKAVVTDSCPLISLDLYRASRSDLVFEKAFSLAAKTDNYLHAFVCYFDITFGSLKERVWFSTGPFHPNTHWKQTIFYTDRDLMLRKDSVVKGKLRIKRNPQNHREIDILIKSLYTQNSIDPENNSPKTDVVRQKRWYYLR